jgi:hypothetical protein
MRVLAPEPPHNTKGGGEGTTLLMQACDLFTTSKHHQERVEQDDHRKRDRKETRARAARSMAVNVCERENEKRRMGGT